MGLSVDELNWIETVLNAPDASAGALSQIRERLPSLSLTRCDPHDLSDDSPFRQYPQFDLYLVDGRNHCWQLTSDPADATGLVVTERKGPGK